MIVLGELHIKNENYALKKAATPAAKVLLAMLNSPLLKFHPFHSLIGARGIYFDLSGGDLRIYAN